MFTCVSPDDVHVTTVVVQTLAMSDTEADERRLVSGWSVPSGLEPVGVEGSLLGGWTKPIHTHRFDATGLPQLAGPPPLAGWTDILLGLQWPFACWLA